MDQNELLEIIRKAKQERATELDLSDKILKALPPKIGKLTQLSILSLSDNQLTVMPPEIGQLTQLTKFSISDNQLTALPPEIGQLTNLTELRIYYNQLTSLPPEIGKLTQLTILSISDNQLISMPPEIGKLTQLERLGLQGNQLRSLPPEIGKLTQLTKLYLHNNQLTSLPPEIGQLTQLTKLYLHNNQLTSLPMEIRQLENLEELYLHDNPRLNIPPEILGPTWGDVIRHQAKPAFPYTILDYYFRIHPPKRVVETVGKKEVHHAIARREVRVSGPLNEAKLILVGPGEAGKTSVVNRLVKDSYNPRESTTHGIRIKQWKQTVGKDEIRLNIWDFGGQDIQHATHQFFLTERSLYLVVLDGRKGREDEDAEYWLKFIKAFGGESPAILVLNKQRMHPYDVNRRALKEKYPFIRAFIPTDCKPKTRNGIPELKREILMALSEMDNVRTPFPANWFGIKDQIARMKKPFIPFDEYRKICTELNESDEKAQESLAYYLSCLGIAINFRTEPRLRETSVLQPQWITKGVYKIITSRRLAHARGELKYSDLSRILPSKAYPEKMHNFLLDLMRKFELCFEFHDAGADRRFLVPELLDKQKPDLKNKFAPEQCLNFRYEYTLLPEGLLPRFIVRTYPMSEGNLRWRTGVVLNWEGCSALVEADAADRQVLIRVTGTTECRRRLLSVIRANFEHIHNEMKEFKPTEWISPEDHPGEWVDYKDLEVSAQKGKPEYSKRIGEGLVSLDPVKMLSHADVKDATRRDAREYRFMAGEGKADLVRMFIGYSHKDDRWRDTLQSNLEILSREGSIDIWYDQRLVPGDEWDDTIKQKLSEAKIVLFLVSTPFLASKYIREVELPMAMERHKAKKARIIPVIVSACSWKRTPLTDLQALPNGAKPLKTCRDRDKACLEIEDGIRAAVEELRDHKSSKG